jgi:hypothetical protein
MSGAGHGIHLTWLMECTALWASAGDNEASWTVRLEEKLVLAWHAPYRIIDISRCGTGSLDKVCMSCSSVSTSIVYSLHSGSKKKGFDCYSKLLRRLSCPGNVSGDD